MPIAANLFYSDNSDTTTLYRRIRRSSDQEAMAQSKWKSVADYLTNRFAKLYGATTRTWLQGSYKFGTLLRPLHKGDQFDIDLGFYLDSPGKTPGSETGALKLKTAVHDGLAAYAKSDADARELEPPKERCERLDFGGDFHIDVPSYALLVGDDERWLATQTRGWEHSDPKALHVWFISKVETPERYQIRRIICYLKAWAGLAYRGKTGEPSSILLTVLVVEAYLTMDEKALAADEEGIFGDVLTRIFARLTRDAAVASPVDKDENLNRLSPTEMAAFLAALESLHDVAVQAAAAQSRMLAAIIWSEAFAHFFPLPEGEAATVGDRVFQRWSNRL